MLVVSVIASLWIRSRKVPEASPARPSRPTRRPPEKPLDCLDFAALERMPVCKIRHRSWDEVEVAADLERGEQPRHPSGGSSNGISDSGSSTTVADSLKDLLSQAEINAHNPITTVPPIYTSKSHYISTTTTQEAPRFDDGSLACSICVEPFAEGESTRVLPCGHDFHPACIDPWLLSVSGTCPLWYRKTHSV